MLDHEARRHYLGASEVAAVCGFDPFKTKLDIWGSKKGWLQREESNAADMGHLLEPVLLQYYADKTGHRLTKPETMPGPECWMAATPDAIAKQPGINVQAKAVGRYMAEHWDHGAPDYVVLQCNWEMMVADLQVTDVVALICSTDPRIIRVERDQKLIDNIVTICRTFWFENVVANVMPTLDGSETATAILRAMYPDRGETIQADAQLCAMARKHNRQAAALKTMKAKHDVLKNRIRQKLGSASCAELPKGRISYRTNIAGDRPLLVRIK